jgi:hypothetical protein
LQFDEATNTFPATQIAAAGAAPGAQRKGNPMSLDLPSPVAAYFAADRRGADSIARCFSERGVVKDEGRWHEGHAAIAQWKADAAAKYNYTSEPFAVEERDGKIVVTAHVAGDFPGSPVDLRYFFGLDGDKIASLEITA